MHACSQSGRPLLSCLDEHGTRGVPRYDVYLQLSPEFSDDPTACWFPQISNIESLLLDYPNSTFVLTTTSPKRWANRVGGHYGQGGDRLSSRLAHCTFPEVDFPDTLPPDGETLDKARLTDPDEWAAMLERMYTTVHKRARRILSRAQAQGYVHWFELDVEQAGAGEWLAHNLPGFGTAAEIEGCWAAATTARAGGRCSRARTRLPLGTAT